MDNGDSLPTLQAWSIRALVYYIARPSLILISRPGRPSLSRARAAPGLILLAHSGRGQPD